jgi:hypothetical protein
VFGVGAGVVDGRGRDGEGEIAGDGPVRGVGAGDGNCDCDGDLDWCLDGGLGPVIRESALIGGIITSEATAGGCGCSWLGRESGVEVAPRSGYTNSCEEDGIVGNCLLFDVPVPIAR